MVDSFVRDVQQGHEEFVGTAPYGSDNVDHLHAFKFIEKAKAKLETSRKKVQAMQIPNALPLSNIAVYDEHFGWCIRIIHQIRYCTE